MPSKIERLLFRFGTNKMRIGLARKWGVRIGYNCILNPPCNLSSEPYMISIGNNVAIAGGCSFLTHDGGSWIFEQRGEFDETVIGPIRIYDYCMLGESVTILMNVKIGPNSIIGAGSLVTQTVPPNSVYAGNPAKYICSMDEYLKKLKEKASGNLPRSIRKKSLLKKYKSFLFD